MRFTHPITKWFASASPHCISICAAAIACFATSAAQADNLRAALLALYPAYSSADALVQFANTCTPGSAAQHNAAFKQWQTGQQLAGYRSLLTKTLSVQDMAQFEASERQNASRLRTAFPNCLTSAQLQQLYNSPKLDLRATQSAPHQTVVAALGSTPLTPSTTSKPTAPSAPAAQPNAAAPARTAGNTSGLEGVYMDQTYSISGFDFTSYAVFKDGRITNDLDSAFGGSPVGRKMRQGRWQRSGSQGFQVTWDDGKQTTLSGATFYRTFAAGSGDALSGTYRYLSTGGNLPLGGSVLTFSADTVVFQPNGVFSSNASSGGSAPGVATSSARTGGGRYSLKGHTITMQYDSGQSVTTGFYFFPSKGQKSIDTIGIGNRIYSLRK